MRRGCGHGIDDCPTSCMEALSEMASEIDEAAAEKHCRWIIANPGAFAGKDYAAHNAARAALAWKAKVKRLADQLRSERVGRWNSASDDPEGRRS